MQKICKKCAKYASNMQVFMILLNIACNMQNMQNNMHDMQNMQTSFPIGRICTAHFADVAVLKPRTWSLSSSKGLKKIRSSGMSSSEQLKLPATVPMGRSVQWKNFIQAFASAGNSLWRKPAMFNESASRSFKLTIRSEVSFQSAQVQWIWVKHEGFRHCSGVVVARGVGWCRLKFDSFNI